MKVVILAGGMGTRISEESNYRPKPMTEIGSLPIILHIMKYYSSFGHNDFVICCGYKGFMIKEYFANYFLHNSDVVIDVKKNNIKLLSKTSEEWTITLVDTGLNTMTGGRLKRIKKFVEDDPYFFMTYGDGLADIDLDKLLELHSNNNKLATLTAVHPPARFGSLDIEGDQVIGFVEKPKGDGSYVNGGFFILSPQVLNLIENDSTVWEQKPLQTLAQQRQLNAYIHSGFWQPMDTLRDKNFLDDLWQKDLAPWKKW